MMKRFAAWCLVGLVGAFGALVFANPAYAQSNTIGFPSSTLCPNTAPPITTGTDPGFPGLWWNPQRYGTGWDLYFTSDQTQIVVYWYTYNGQGQPIWLYGGTDTASTAANGAKQFWAPLYLITEDPTTGTQGRTQVGQVSIAFVPGSTTIASLRWLWNSVSTSATHDECVYQISHASAPAGGSGT